MSTIVAVSAPAVLTAISIMLFANLALNTLLELFERGLRRRVLSVVGRVTTPANPEVGVLTETELYGLPAHFALWMLGAALGGLIFSVILLDGPTRLLGLAIGFTPLLWKRRRVGQAKQRIRRDVADLIEDLRLQITFGGSLGSALAITAKESTQTGIVIRRLRAYSDLIGLEGPEEVLRRLTADLRSPELKIVLARVRAARKGNLPYGDVLRGAADDVAAEITRLAEAEVEGAPLKLLFPMLILLMPSILIMSLYPPASSLIDVIAGSGPVLMPR